MTNAITLSGVVGTDAFTTANTSITGMSPTTIGNCMFVVTRVQSQTVGITSMSGGGCAVWDKVGTFSSASGGGTAETIDLWVGVVTATGAATLTLTPSASIAALQTSAIWQQFTVSGVAANTSWVAELAATVSNTASTNITYPSLTPTGPNRLYLGFSEPNGTPNTTGATAGYTAQVDTNAVANRGQLITNPTLTSGVAAAPVGTQATSATSIACAVLLVATNPDTTVATNLNIGSGSGQNHFKLQTAFSNYAVIDEYTQAQIAGGWNTDPQFVATATGAVQFSVAGDAPTTGNSAFPRSELREMATDGVTDYAFNALAGVHYLRGRIKVTAMPGADSSPPRVRTTLCQLHDGVTNIGEVIKLYVQDNTSQSYRPELRLSVWDSGTGMPKYVLNFAVQDQFDFMIKVDNTVASGYWAVYYQDLGTPVYDSNDYIADGFTNVFSGLSEYYFKTGSYPTTNETTLIDPRALSTVELSYLQHWHTGWPTPSPAITLPKTFQFAPSFG